MNTDELITLVEASELCDVPYSTLAEAARGTRRTGESSEPRLRTKRSGKIYLTTARWVKEALSEGRIGRRRGTNFAQD